MPPFFISLEGNVCSGKDTWIKHLGDWKNIHILDTGFKHENELKLKVFENPKIHVHTYLRRLIDHVGNCTNQNKRKEYKENDVIFMNKSFYSIPKLIQAHLQADHIGEFSAKILLDKWEITKEEHRPIKPVAVVILTEPLINQLNCYTWIRKNKTINEEIIRNVNTFTKCYHDVLSSAHIELKNQILFISSDKVDSAFEAEWKIVDLVNYKFNLCLSSRPDIECKVFTDPLTTFGHGKSQTSKELGDHSAIH